MSNRQDLVKKELIKGRWNNRYYSLVYYDRAPDHKNLKFLSNIGAEVIESVAENFLLVRFKEIPPSDFMNISGIKGVCQFPAKEKISQKLNEVFIASSDQRVLRISVLLYSSEDVAFSSKQLTQLGFVSTNNQYNNKCVFIGDIPKNKILDIASLPCVKYVGLFDYEPKPLLFRENGALGLPNLRNDIFGKGLSGKDVTVGIGDDGDPTSHLDNRFNNSNRNPMPINFSAHGTSVTGIVSSDGIIDERFTGVAPQSSTVTDFFDLIIAKTETYAKDFRMTVTNNSYYNAYDRCIGNSEYNELSVYADDQILALDTVQHIFAAGNDGELTCSPYPAGFGTIKSGYQTAKNILSVGNYAFSFNPRIIASTSSRGPVADGRLKPEIVAPGDAIFSTTLNNGYSNQHWGTSFAAPFVAGTWSFLTEQYRKLNNGKTPPSGLLKSIICNSASDKGNTGPDFSHGFGLLNPTRALQVIDKNQYAEDSITTGAQKSYSLAVPADIKQVKIMLYWHDRPGSPISLKALQNDLDLSVIDGSNNYLPWILNSTPTNIQNLASRGLDRINNIEQITIDNPGSNLTVNVFGHAITGSKQKFYLTWDFIKDDLKILRPAGGERLTAGASEVISWDAIDNQNDSLSLEYSLDNGQSWTTITNTNVSRMFIGWSIPANTATSEAKIRLTRIRDGAVAVTPGVFTIVGVPQLTLNTVCDGAVDLSWTQIGNASDYEVLQLKGGEWTRIGITSGSSFSIRGLNKLESYWFTVRARFQGTFGRRAAAKMVTPKLDTPCQNAEFNNDLTIDALLSPANAREFTSSSLGNSESVKIRIKNLDNASSPGTFGVFYQINEGAIIEEQVNVSIPQGAFIVYTFNTKADFSLPGNYNLKVWVKQAGDGRPENDTCTYLIRFLNNSPVSLPYTDNFENTGKDEYLTGSFGLKNIDRFDLFTTTTNGRARTFVNTGMSLEGNRAIT
ncbi:MAG: S8 family serine peptidase, partial [Bacteroidota bacterium]